MTSTASEHARLARAVAAVADISAREATARVAAAAQAHLLPARLDEAGMLEALNAVLAAAPAAGRHHARAAGVPEARYYRLAEVCGPRLAAGVLARVARAAALGVPPARERGEFTPAELLEVADTDPVDDDPGRGGDTPQERIDWWRRLVDAGPRPDVALPDPYPAGHDPDGGVPIDHALDRRDATSDVDAYERDLKKIIRVEPRDIDAYAHLGHLYLSLASPGGELIVTPPPDARQQATWVRTALGHYQSGVAIAELAMPDPFTAVLRWAELDNRPFLRALHGLTLALWRLGRFEQAQTTLHNMLWLNPADNQGARLLLPDVANRHRWGDTDDR